MKDEEILMLVSVFSAAAALIMLISIVNTANHIKAIRNLMMNQETRWVRLHNEKIKKEKSNNNDNTTET
ncbi:hypothetical protein OAL26_02770 [Flavobacteriales bacterium]|nr:hypothetical protein [Flavobacteriales bacterium]